MELPSHRTNDARQSPGVVHVFGLRGRSVVRVPLVAQVHRLLQRTAGGFLLFTHRLSRPSPRGLESQGLRGASGVAGGRVWWPPRQHRVRDLRGESADGPELAAAGNEDQSPRHAAEISGTSNYVEPVSQLLRRGVLPPDTREGPGASPGPSRRWGGSGLLEVDHPDVAGAALGP